LSNNSDKFLEAFNAIEKYMRRMTGSDNQTSFYRLIDRAADSDSAVRSLRIDLQEYADLRNAIVHERTDGHVIAEPNERALKKIEQMKVLITQPPTIRAFMTQNVTTFQIIEPIGTAVKEMFDHEFSQAPVYNGQQFTGLLTANTITRWLGKNVAEEIFSLEETSIGKVLEYTEDSNHVAFMEPDTSIYELLEHIQNQEARGTHLEAILVTDSGRKNISPLGIITIWDLPKIHQAIVL
jgi:predicted transcriptional regulator